MRLDKFLKVSRLIKRRSVAKEASASDKITVNGRVAKPSTALKVNDEVTIHYFKKEITIRILQLVDSTKKQDAESMYEILRESSEDQRAM